MTHVTEWGGGDVAPEDPTIEMRSAPAGSLHERLLAAREAAPEPHVKLDVTAGRYAGLIRIEYRPLPWALFERLASRLNAANDVNANLDAMGQCCVRVLGVHPDGLEEVLDDGEGALRLDDRLAVYLQMACAQGPTPPTSREVIIDLFDGNGLALAAHATDLIEWAKAPDRRGEIDPGKS